MQKLEYENALTESIKEFRAASAHFKERLMKETYKTDCWAADDPGELPPPDRIIANHVANGLIESISSECPRESNAFEENDPEESQAAHGIFIQQIENIHSSLYEKEEDDLLSRKDCGRKVH